MNDEAVTLSTYPINQNTTFVADVTYKYDVKYIVDGETYGDPQIVTAGEYPTVPTAPTKAGYTFMGYTLDGVNIVDPATTPVTGHMTYIAKFVTAKHEVKFMIDNTQYGDTQLVNQNMYSTVPSNPTKDDLDFLGWTLNGVIVNPATVPITSDTIFVASFGNLLLNKLTGTFKCTTAMKKFDSTKYYTSSLTYVINSDCSWSYKVDNSYYNSETDETPYNVVENYVTKAGTRIIFHKETQSAELQYYDNVRPSGPAGAGWVEGWKTLSTLINITDNSFVVATGEDVLIKVV